VSSSSTEASTVDVQVESPATGRLQEIIVDVGTAGELQGDTAQAHSGTAQRGTPEARRSGPRRYSPVVMRIAAQHEIDLEQVEGTGRGGRVRKQDVLAFIDNGGGAEQQAAPPMHIESPYRPDAPPAPRKPKSRLGWPEAAPAPAALRTAATCTTVVEADLHRVEAARRASGLTYLPYIARATIEVLREYPSLNATLEAGTVTTYDGVHLGIAVALGEGGGLIVPVIRDAQDLSVEGLASRIKDVARRARDNELSPDEVRGGTLTITNPGGYGRSSPRRSSTSRRWPSSTPRPWSSARWCSRTNWATTRSRSAR
jgi:pyruvate/2-oxoglutarate dehydrogenase complex dihydrolipoamide acyltransferase (E2) component